MDYRIEAQLQQIYDRTRGPVAFCDESYRISPAGQVGFYSITAVICDRQQLGSTRDALVAVAGRRPWHTTQEYEAGRDHRIHQMLNAVAAGSQWGILTVHAPVNGHDGKAHADARASCLKTLLPEITRGTDPVRVVVMDTLGDDRKDGADRRLAAQLRGDRTIGPQTLLRHADDRHEPLLWAPDVVGWAARRLLARDETHWFAHVLDVSTVLDARTGARLDGVQLYNSAVAAAAPTTPDGGAGLTPAVTGSARPPLLPASSSPNAREVARRSASRSMSELLRQAAAAPPTLTPPAARPAAGRRPPPTRSR